MKNAIQALLIFLCLTYVSSATAQYSSALGLSFGKFATGINYKQMSGRTGSTGFEVLAAYTREAKGGYTAKAFFVKKSRFRNSSLHAPFFASYGVGGHVGYFRKNYFIIKEDHPVYYKDNTIAAGLDAKLGIEWNSRSSPLTIEVAGNPSYNLLNPGPEWIDFTLSVRYILD